MIDALTDQVFRPCEPAVTAGHRQVVAWMNTKPFRDIVAIHRKVCGPSATIYFRPTNRGLVRIALHPRAPGYVGFRKQKGDGSHLVSVHSPVPTVRDTEERLRAFESWLPTVRRSSAEEAGVISWISRALEQQLQLPAIGQDWTFLHQEWRFIDETGKGKKSDVLAVHCPSGQLGIIEFKASERALDAARPRVMHYGRIWDRDAVELAPVFTDLLRAMGKAYGNDAAASATVSRGPAALFVGVASASSGVNISPV